MCGTAAWCLLYAALKLENARVPACGPPLEAVGPASCLPVPLVSQFIVVSFCLHPLPGSVRWGPGPGQPWDQHRGSHLLPLEQELTE